MEKKDEKTYINVDYFEDLTGDVLKSTSDDLEEIGERIRNLREEKGLSLDEFSNLTGFDIDLLSKIEKNEIQPQLGTIIKLSKALDSALGHLVSGIGDQPYSITRKNDRKPIYRSTSRKGKKQLYTYRSLAPEVEGRHMEALLVLLEECLDEEASVHQGEEFIYILDGFVVLKLGNDVFEFEPGDSVYYLSTIPHLISAKKEKATILAVLYEG